MRSFFSPLAISAQFYGYLKLLELHRTERSQNKDVRSGNRTQDLLHQGRALTDCAILAPGNIVSVPSSVCTALGLPLHPAKKVGPTTCLVTLGIELDLINQLACLLTDKIDSLLNILHHWASYRWCTKRQLQSLIGGHLHHAAKVVWPGRAFICRMINLL